MVGAQVDLDMERQLGMANHQVATALPHQVLHPGLFHCPTVTLTGYDAPSSGYESPSSGGGHGHSRTLEDEARSGPAAPKFHYQWQQNIANLGRRKRATTELEGVNTFLDVRCSVSV